MQHVLLTTRRHSIKRSAQLNCRIQPSSHPLHLLRWSGLTCHSCLPTSCTNISSYQRSICYQCAHVFSALHMCILSEARSRPLSANRVRSQSHLLARRHVWCHCCPQMYVCNASLLFVHKETLPERRWQSRHCRTRATPRQPYHVRCARARELHCSQQSHAPRPGAPWETTAPKEE